MSITFLLDKLQVLGLSGTAIPPLIIIKLFVNFVEQSDKKTPRVLATFIDLSIIFDSEDWNQLEAEMCRFRADSPGPFPPSATRLIKNLHLIPLFPGQELQPTCGSDTGFTPITRRRKMAFLWYINAIILLIYFFILCVFNAIVLISRTRRAFIDIWPTYWLLYIQNHQLPRVTDFRFLNLCTPCWNKKARCSMSDLLWFVYGLNGCSVIRD